MRPVRSGGSAVVSGLAGNPMVDVLAELVMEVRGLRREVAALRDPAPADRLLTVAEKAAELGRSHDWVREHRRELGAVTVGTGPKPRLFFPPGAPRSSTPAKATPAPRREFPPIRARR